MKLWLLKEREDNTIQTEIGRYDTYDGFVIRAKDEKAARLKASSEVPCMYMGKEDWLNPDIVECKEISKNGNEEVILSSFNAG